MEEEGNLKLSRWTEAVVFHPAYNLSPVGGDWLERDDCGGCCEEIWWRRVSSASPSRDGGERVTREAEVVVGMKVGEVGEPRELWRPSPLSPSAVLCCLDRTYFFFFFRFKTLGSLAGLHAHLLPGGWLFCLRLRAGVGAAVESRHGAAFGVGVQAAVRRGIVGLELSWALHFLQSADCVDTKEQRTQIYWRNDWSEETLLIIILCFYKLDRNLIRMHSKH